MSASFSSAWMAGDARAIQFLPDPYKSDASRISVVKMASRRRMDPAVHRALVEHNASLPKSALREKHLAQLADGAVSVVTGQQAGLFLGPLYTVYKTAAAIVNARALSATTGIPCVPVFWLQSEDHDLDEINTCAVPTGRTDVRTLKIAGLPSSRVPVAHQKLGPGVEDALSDLEAEIAALPFAREHLDALKRTYRADNTFTRGFEELLAELFSDEGLVFVDPRDPRLAPLAAPVHRRALDDADAISDVLIQRADALASSGFDVQVHVRRGSPLFFYAPDGAQGQRYRLEKHGDAFTFVSHGGSVTTEELRAQLEKDPMRFTTSALLRPILQDTWLPNAAYVGGPGEVAYFSQLSSLYEHLHLAMPMIVPRARFRVVDDKVLALVEKSGVSVDDLTLPRDALLARIAKTSTEESPESVEKKLLAPLLDELAKLEARAQHIEPGLVKAVKRTHDHVSEAIGKLVGKYGRALAQRDQVAIDRLDRARAFLAPDGEPQERVFGISHFAARYGARAFIESALRACEPFNGQLKELRP